MKERGYVKSWGRVCLDSGNSKCKGPKASRSLACFVSVEDGGCGKAE